MSVDLDVPSPGNVRSLWLQIHGVSFTDMASVQVNGHKWLPINNESAVVAEPGKSYGGIGGGFATLKLTIPLSGQIFADGANTVRFRFNRTNGVASGFRVLDFNFLEGDGRKVLSQDSFQREDPNSWTPPLSDGLSIAAGRQWWHESPLTANGLPNAPPIRAHCADCHTRDGRDLKYFNFSNQSIIARSRFHGLTKLQGEQIASYVRSLPGPNPGRPWDPPYQPGPRLESQPAANWAAGAGLAWALDDDSETLRFIFPGSADSVRTTKDVFRPDGDLDQREVPISMQLPDWNHWLPRVHPLDAWGNDFADSDLARVYQAGRAEQDLRARLGSTRRPKPEDGIDAVFEQWTKTRQQLLEKHLPVGPGKWSPDLAEKAYSTQLWQLVKTWELTQELGLEGGGRDLLGPSAASRTWCNAMPAATAPDAVGIPDGPNGMGGSALTNEYFNNAWYELQFLVSGGRRRLGTDRLYMIGRFLDLRRESRRAEPGRLLVAVIKSLQSTDPAIGPEDATLGWRPDQNIDPRIMISQQWSPMFEPLPVEQRRSITESMLSAWLDKDLQYQTSRYFTRGLSGQSYAMPAGLAGISGGKVWQAAAGFQAAGVSPTVVARLRAWGRSYADMASRFAY